MTAQESGTWGTKAKPLAAYRRRLCCLNPGLRIFLRGSKTPIAIVFLDYEPRLYTAKDAVLSSSNLGHQKFGGLFLCMAKRCRSMWSPHLCIPHKANLVEPCLPFG